MKEIIIYGIFGTAGSKLDCLKYELYRMDKIRLRT